jgi:cell division protein YceG involved in septum cleavage/uncharacterized caspase-like protein
MHLLRRLSAISVLTLFSMGLFAGTSFAETRVALVIGNGAYRNAPRLPNPSNDATDVAAALKRSSFETILATDLDKAAMDAATIKFARAARTADVALFYYSGHAIQFGGVNYLTPVDAKLTDEADLRRMVRVDEIVSDLQQAKNLRILVLDSCRDNPLADELKRSIGSTRSLPLQRGLAKIENAQGMIVAYATQSGRTADDGDGRNSPYTAAFVKNIEAQEEIGTIFRRISTDVYETTKHSQLPELSLSLIGEFYLRGKLEVKPEAPTSPPDTVQRDFEATERVDTVSAWSAFLAQHPDGFYSTLAKERRATSAAKLAALPKPNSVDNGAINGPLAEGEMLFDATKAGGLTSDKIVQYLLMDDRFSGSITEWTPEGSLLLGSYKFPQGTSRNEVIRRMQAAQRQVVSEVWDQLYGDLPYRSREDFITMASIVESETSRDDERGRVAAVYVNRLRQKIKLQSEATMVYGIVGGKGALGHPITRNEVGSRTPYNTYVIDGLPQGPIANVSRASLEATAKPARTRDLFFDADGKGGHKFSETYADHAKNVADLREIEKQDRSNDTVKRP